MKTNREKNHQITRCFFSPFTSLINREKLCVNRDKDRHQKSTIFSSFVFHRLRPVDFRREMCGKFSNSCTQTLENVARGKFQQRFTANFTTPLAEKNRKTEKTCTPNFCRLQGGCSDIFGPL